MVVKLFNFPHLARSRQVPVAACALATVLLACPASSAAQSDTLKLALNDTFSYNSNLLRTPDSAAPRWMRGSLAGESRRSLRS